MSIFRTLALAFVMVLGAASLSHAAELSAAECAKRIDSFNYLVDYSGSMMMKHKGQEGNGAVKMTLAKEAIARVNATVPALDYSGGLYTFAPYQGIVNQTAWDRDELAAGIAKISDELDIYARFTPMGPGMGAHTPVIMDMIDRAAVILVSDGEANRGVDPVAEAKLIYRSNPNVRFHIISLADTPEGEATLNAIAALAESSVVVKATDLIASDAVVKNFVSTVFCMPVMVEEVIVLRGVNFAFDSSELDPTAQGVLNEAANLIRSQENYRVVLAGYTDSVGSDAYNQALSQRRADAVMKYLEMQGIPAAYMTAVGEGESFRYDNDTEEGRYMNRRCELAFEEVK